MTKPVDLDALDAIYNAPRRRCLFSGSGIEYPEWIRLNSNQDAAEQEILNAYPAMAAELRALREVAEAARAFVPRCAVLCREPATHESVGGIYLCDAHTARHRDLGGHADPLALGTTGDALRAALAKVPR
jgi:hypothetical protein